MYDFYLLSTLPETGDINLDDARKQANDALLPVLKKNLLDAVFFSICAELRHVGYASQDPEQRTGYYPEEDKVKDDLLGPQLVKVWDAYQRVRPDVDDESERLVLKGPRKGEAEKYVDSWKAAKKTGFSERQIVKMAEILYRDLNWDGSYGGENWANIAKGWLNLNNAKNRGQMMVMIDRIYQLQHNSDTVFNKLREYMKGRNHRWLQRALDRKFRARSPYDFINKASGTLQRLARHILKQSYGTTLQSHQQQRQAEFNRKFKDTDEIREIEYIHSPPYGKKVIHLPEKEIKRIAKRVQSGEVDEISAELYMKHGSKLGGDVAIQNFYEALGIELPHRVTWMDVMTIVRNHAREYVRNNFEKVSDIASKTTTSGYDLAGAIKTALEQALNVPFPYAEQIYWAWSNFSKSMRDEDESITGNRITHRKKTGYQDIFFRIPGKFDPYVKGRGVEVYLNPYILRQIQGYFKELGKDPAEEMIDDRLNLSPKARDALLDYIAKGNW
jgi:hypothetical protein